MVNKNLEKLPEIYTVSYFNESEWNKDLTTQEILKSNELAELEYQDNLLRGSQFGPGNTQSSDSEDCWDPGSRSWSSSSGGNSSRNYSVAGRINSVAETGAYVSEVAFKTAVIASINSTIGLWAPVISGGVWIGGEWLQSRNNAFLKFVGTHLKGLGGGVFFNGMFENKIVGEVAKNIGINLKDLEKLFEIKGSAETLWEVGKHGQHKDRGISYDPNCEVCRL